jgi:hypothetical protein
MLRDMSQNIITSIPADALVGLTNFRILIMADNLLSTLPATAAVSTTLQELYVAPSSDAAAITLWSSVSDHHDVFCYHSAFDGWTVRHRRMQPRAC